MLFFLLSGRLAVQCVLVLHNSNTVNTSIHRNIVYNRSSNFDSFLLIQISKYSFDYEKKTLLLKISFLFLGFFTFTRVGAGATQKFGSGSSQKASTLGSSGSATLAVKLKAYCTQLPLTCFPIFVASAATTKQKAAGSTIFFTAKTTFSSVAFQS